MTPRVNSSLRLCLFASLRNLNRAKTQRGKERKGIEFMERAKDFTSQDASNEIHLKAWSSLASHVHIFRGVLASWRK
jgi:hypothetical protein